MKRAPRKTKKDRRDERRAREAVRLLLQEERTAAVARWYARYRVKYPASAGP